MPNTMGTISNGHEIVVIPANNCSGAFTCNGSSDMTLRWPRSQLSRVLDYHFLSSPISTFHVRHVVGGGVVAYSDANFISHDVYGIMEQRPALIIKYQTS